MTTQHQRDDDPNDELDGATGELAPDDHKPTFLEKVKDLFDPSDDLDASPGKRTMEDWEVSTLEGGSNQGPH